MTLTRFGCGILCVLLAAWMSGCAPLASKDADEEPSAVAAPPEQRTPPQPMLPPQDLTQQLLYEYLIAEMAVHRQQYGVAAQAYLELARKTRDPRIARRATDIAVFAREPALAIEAATLWLQAEPSSVTARQTLASILISTGALQDVRPHLEMLLAADPKRAGQVFLQINSMLARHADKVAVAKLVQELARAYPRLAEAHFAAAQACWNADLI